MTSKVWDKQHGDKNGKEDILKAIHFLEMIIERDYSETDI